MTDQSDRSLRADLLDDVYSSHELLGRLPKAGSPAAEKSPRHVFAAVRDELMLDGNSRQSLATFCQTWIDDDVRDLMALSIDKNMIDKDEYPQTAEIEARCVRMLADLWNAPAPETTLGCSTIGSSEAAMLGGLALKWRWRKARQAAGTADRPNMICGPDPADGVQTEFTCWTSLADLDRGLFFLRAYDGFNYTRFDLRALAKAEKPLLLPFQHIPGDAPDGTAALAAA